MHTINIIDLSDIRHTPHAHDRYQFGSIRWTIVTLSAIGGCARSWRGVCLPTHGVSQSHHWRYHIAGNIWGGKFYKFHCLRTICESVFSLICFPLYGMGSEKLKGIRDVEGIGRRRGRGRRKNVAEGCKKLICYTQCYHKILSRCTTLLRNISTPLLANDA